MITDSIYFTQKTYSILEQVENEIENAITVEKFIFKNFTRAEIYDSYCSIFYAFPYRIIPKNDFIGISINSIEVLDGGSSFDEHKSKNKLYDFEIEEFLQNRKTFNPKDCFQTVEFFIDEYFNKLCFNYAQFLESAKKFPFFTGISDEKTIILNLLKHYKSTLNDNSIQIDFFWAIQLPKKINDQILKLLIEYLEQRLSIINIKFEELNFENKTNVYPEYQTKIIWNGSQQQLCELFLKLEENSWIEKNEDGNLKLFVSSLCNLFDIKKTKKKDDSDEITSLYQIFKGEISDKVKIYPFLEKPRYKKIIEKMNKNDR